MPRLKVVDPATTTGKVRELFDGPLAGKHLNIFKGVANSPAVLPAYVAFSGALKEGDLTDREREVIALVTAQANNCNYCLAAHTFIGKTVGLSDEETLDARRVNLKDAKLNALATFVKALHEKKGFVDDADLENFRAAGYGDSHIAEVVANYALNVMTNYFNHVNDTVVDLPAAPPLG